MRLSIPLMFALAVASPLQAQEKTNPIAGVAPIVGEGVVAVVHLDLARLDVAQTSKRLLVPVVDEGEVAGVAQALADRIDLLKKAGATDLFLMVDLADMPGYPVAVVPLPKGNDGKAIVEALVKEAPNSPIRWASAAIIRGSAVAGSDQALARIRDAKPADHPELAAALAPIGGSPARVAIIPSPVQRRALEESLPNLPPPLGGPITTITRGMTWATLSLATEPGPTVRVEVQAKDPEAAKALQKMIRDGLGHLAQTIRSTPADSELADALAKLDPEAKGDKVLLSADLAKATALVAVPVQQVREATRRTECVNNLKTLGLAMHNYHSAHSAFPAAYSTSKDGKPLLSWRVQILPFLDEQKLYDEFHHDEPWDSPRNKALIAKMPKVYTCPSGNKALANEWKTTYLTPRGPATLFPGAKGLPIKEVTDGSSNTILVVDAADELAVTWTKPDDWTHVEPFTTKGFFGHHRGGTDVLMADGSVHFFKDSTNPKILQGLTTRNGGEIFKEDF